MKRNSEREESVALLRARIHRDLGESLGRGDFEENLMAHLRATDPSCLLFTPGRLPDIARAAREVDPAQADWEREIAENAMEWRFYGASNAYCRRFLALDRKTFDFRSVDHEDPQALYGLNRLRWFAALGRTYWETGDAACFRALMDHWDFFIEKVPFPGDAFSRQVHAVAPFHMKPPFGELDTFIRLTNWYWAYWTALFAPEMTPDRHAILLARCLRMFDLVAARGIKRHEHNFTAMQMEALFLWATALPGFTGMSVWKHAARNIIESSLARAVYEDGVHWEKSAGYHAGCLCWYGTSFLLGRRSGEPFAEACGERLRRMAAYLDAILTPDGRMPLLSDSDRSGGSGQALALARCIFPDLRFARPVPPSYLGIWAGDGATWEAEVAVKEIDPVQVFPEGGVAAVRNAGAGGPRLLIDNGPTHAGHSHFDNLTLHYDLPQGPCIVDPGRWIYRSDADRAWVVHPASHNTVTIEDTPIRPGDWLRDNAFATILGPEDVRAGPIVVSEDTTCRRLVTTFRGYAADAGADVERTVVFPRSPDENWLAVMDRILAPVTHRWTTAWLLPASTPARRIEGGIEIDLDSGFSLRVALAGTNRMTVRDDSMFWCPNYAEKAPARWLRFSSRLRRGRRVFLFAPQTGRTTWPRVRIEKDRVLLDAGVRQVEIPFGSG